MNHTVVYNKVHNYMKGQESKDGSFIKNDAQHLSFKKGQRVTEIVSTIEDVVKANVNDIELSVLIPKEQQNIKCMEAIIRLDADRDVLLSKKKQEEKQSEREEDHKKTMSKMEKFLARITEQDYRSLEAEGFSLDKLTISGLEAAITRLKKGGSSNNAANADKHGGRRPKADGIYSGKEIKQHLENANLPSDAETVSKVMAALELSTSVGKPEESAIRNLIHRGLSPTIENLYKAQYSMGNTEMETPISEAAWAELAPQVKQVIEAAGYEVNLKNLEKARWLLENGLPLTKENLIYYNRLSEMEKMTEQTEALDSIIQEMHNGKAPKDAIIISGYEERQALIDRINSVGEKELLEAARTEKEITIKLLTEKKYREAYLQETKNKEISEQHQLEAIRAKRLLEEIRLRMTVGAAGNLERKGIHIETQSLERVVEELKILEESYYRSLFREIDIEAGDEQLQILRETTRAVNQLTTIPSYVLGFTLQSRKLQTIPSLLEEGAKLNAQLDKAKEAYDNLMTEPNREYGDSIQKAFKKSDLLLKEMGLDNTEYNRRAIRILGYNSIELTRENINYVKSYDLEVNQLINNLQPAVTVRLIKNGINPMGLPINELNLRINELIEKEGISSEERFSTYLRRLDKDHQLSEEERRAYIGIYRLLHTIDKSDGAALGAVLKAEQEVTLNNLLTAVRSQHKGGIDTSIDDSFGMLQKLESSKDTITDQIGQVFGKELTDNAQGNNAYEGENIDEVTGIKLAKGTEAELEFLKGAVGHMLAELSPEGLSNLQTTLYHNVLPAFRASGEAEPMKGVWEDIKELSIDKLYDLLNKDMASKTSDPIYAEKLQQLKQAYQNAEQSIRFLEDLRIPCTTANIIMAEQVLSDTGSFIKRYFQLRQEDTATIFQNNLQNTEELTDTLIDKDSMREAYDKISTETNELQRKESESERIDSKRLTELKNLNLQLSFLKTLAEKEFYQIPIETKHGMLGINLTIIRGTGTTGKVNVSFQSKVLGRVKADLALKNKQLNGYIASDSRIGAEAMKNCLQPLKDMLTEENIAIKQLDICYDSHIKDSQYLQRPEEESSTNPNKDKERMLYRLAKSLVQTIREAEAGNFQYY